MKPIRRVFIYLALALLVLFVLFVTAGFARAVWFVPAGICLLGYLWLSRTLLKCPHCGGFINVATLLHAIRHESHCLSCGGTIDVE